MEDMYNKMSGSIQEVINQWPCANVLERHGDIQMSMLRKTFQVIKLRESRFNVLCHGDLWCNNVMFKYNEETEKVEEAIFVDFQMCLYNSPMLDLQYFIYSSLQQEIRMTRVDHIIAYYHKQLVSNLKLLGYSKKLPTLLDLHKDFLELGLYGVMTSFGTLSIAMAPGGEDSDMDTMMSGNEAGVNLQKRIYSNPAYVKVMDELVRYFDMKGFFEQCLDV